MDLKSTSKDDVINEMIDVLAKDGVLNNKEEFKKAIYERESLSTTGVGMGIAIPHAKTSAVKTPRVAVGISKKGFDFASEDGKPAYIVFMIAVTDSDNNLHLDTLAKISGKVMHEDFLEALKNAKTKDEVISLLEK